MANKVDNKLRSLLRKYEFPTLPEDFTVEVIKEVEGITEEKVFASPKLKAALQKNVLAEPSNEFTYKVLNRVREPQPLDYPPVIGKKVWISIGIFAALCIIVAFFYESGTEPVNGFYFYIPIADYLNKLTTGLIETLFYVGVIVLSSGLLLLFDHFFQRKLRSKSH